MVMPARKMPNTVKIKFVRNKLFIFMTKILRVLLHTVFSENLSRTKDNLKFFNSSDRRCYEAKRMFKKSVRIRMRNLKSVSIVYGTGTVRCGIVQVTTVFP